MLGHAPLMISTVTVLKCQTMFEVIWTQCHNYIVCPPESTDQLTYSCHQQLYRALCWSVFGWSVGRLVVWSMVVQTLPTILGPQFLLKTLKFGMEVMWVGVVTVYVKGAEHETILLEAVFFF